MAEVRRGSGVWHDADGVVVEAPKRRRVPPRHPLTAAQRMELEAKEAWRERKAQERARKLALLEELVPSLPTEDEPRPEGAHMIEIDGRTGRGQVLCEAERENTSRVMLLGKHYDGFEGREPRDYAHLSVWYRTGHGVQLRTRGVALESAAEARAVAEALLRWAEEVEG